MISEASNTWNKGYTRHARNSKALENIWAGAKRLSSSSTVRDDSNNNIHHEHIGDASKSDVSPNTPSADEADS